ncbi:hypothetical protein C6497_04965 [Candidatus Poribacteria bacterium]|nr:MAG: hypothetical protein C6497_04965 [Candidatus Poribacteria bacterium]
MYLKKPILRKTHRERHRIKAFVISLVIHFVIVIVFFLFFLNQGEFDIEKIPSETLPELPIQMVNKKETLDPKLTMVNEEIPVPQNRHVKREVNIVKPNQSKEIAKLNGNPIQSENQGQLMTSSKFVPHFDNPNLSTDILLKPNVESIMSPELPSGVIRGKDSKARNFKSKGNSQKNTGKGVRETGSGKKNGSSSGESEGNKDGSGTGNGSGGTGNGKGNTSRKTIEKMTNDIIASSGGNPIDVVLVLDRSGSVNDSIRSLTEHLSDESDAYKTSKIDLLFGLTIFYTRKHSKKEEHIIELLPLTRNISAYKQEYYSIRIAGDEYVLDAILHTVTKVKFRTDSMKHLILLTDEIEFTSIHRHTLDSVIKLCQKSKISVNVFGGNYPDHKRIAKETGGSWYKIPIHGMK